MAAQTGERTEKPTFKRIKDAREKGQVARSRDLSAAASYVAATVVLIWAGGAMASAMALRFERGFEDAATLGPGSVTVLTLADVLWRDAALLGWLVGPVALAAALVSVGASVAQTGWLVSPKALELNWGRLNPAKGFSKFAPKQAGLELVKAVVGLSALGYFSYVLVRAVVDESTGLAGMMPEESARLGWDRVVGLLWRAGLVLAVLAVGDYGLQRWRWYGQLKMTRQEVRDEARQQDGNPEIKGRVRRIQREMAKKRMLQDVKKATVVITNPTHFAVALEYRRPAMAAPVVVAKGQDELAARIRTVAREHNVPIVENVALARALYRTAEVGEPIPADLFGAVAEVLAYLVRLKQLIL